MCDKDKAFTLTMSLSEGNAMSNRILRTIEKMIKNDRELQEFIIIPTPENIKNKSPVLYDQHNIGLESWCVRHVYQYACSTLFNHREQLAKRNFPSYKIEDLNYLLVGAILINPDVGTFWNMKRELIELDFLNVEEELYFSKIVLSSKSKSNEAFSYRRWLLERIIHKLESNNLEVSFNILQNELRLVHSTSEKSANNYHSWNHRIWCMENISLKFRNLQHIISSELSYSQEWINTHVSEHAGYHYRQYLIKFIKKNKNTFTVYESYYNFVITQLLDIFHDGEYRNILDYLLGKSNNSKTLRETYLYVNYICVMLYDLFVFTEHLDKLFPDHESLFYHRRFLMYHLLRVSFEYHSPEQKIRYQTVETDHNSRTVVTVETLDSNIETNKWPKLFKISPTKPEVCKLSEIIVNREKKFLGSNNSTMQSIKYQKWLTHIIGFE